MNPLSVSQLAQQIQQVIETELAPLYWVVGELADFRQAPQGHVYFELVEKQDHRIQAKIRANLWQFTYRAIAPKFAAATGTNLKTGMKVLAQVSVNYHPIYGLSITVKDIDPSFSLGERSRQRQETIDRLTREGLLRLNARFELPPVVQKIAIISSATAAGYGDFVNQLENNPYGYKVYHRLFPSLMQGNEAVSGLISALEKVENSAETLGIEAVVIIRGGGAQLDLDCFDEYLLAEKIARFPLPIFTGIGHERDETVADLVAHTRLKTPTAVAEFLLDGFRALEENLALAIRRLDRATRSKLKEENSLVHQLELRTRSLSQNRLNLSKESITMLSRRIQQAGKNLLRIQAIHLESQEKTLTRVADLFLKNQTERIHVLENQIRQLDPKSILQKGYTRTEINGKPIHQTSIKEGDILETYTLSQKLTSTLIKIEEK